jgi:hypothetical protein
MQAVWPAGDARITTDEVQSRMSSDLYLPTLQIFVYFLQYNLLVANINVPWPSWWKAWINGILVGPFHGIDRQRGS